MSAGVELCAVVEAMYSYEMLFSITGDPVFGMYEHNACLKYNLATDESVLTDL